MTSGPLYMRPDGSFTRNRPAGLPKRTPSKPSPQPRGAVLSPDQARRIADALRVLMRQ